MTRSICSSRNCSLRSVIGKGRRDLLLLMVDDDAATDDDNDGSSSCGDDDLGTFR